MDGKIWTNVDGGAIFAGNLDSNTIVRHNFATPGMRREGNRGKKGERGKLTSLICAVFARAIRIHPVTYTGYITNEMESGCEM